MRSSPSASPRRDGCAGATRVVTVNGIGNAWCGYGAAVRWRPGGTFVDRGDHDTVECFVVCFLPIVPYAARHTFEWYGERCRTAEIRATPWLLARAFLRPLAWVGASVAALVLFAVLAGAISKGAPVPWTEAELLGGALSLCVTTHRVLEAFNRRHRDVRLVLGRHALGSSDPAMWPEGQVQALARSAAGAGLGSPTIEDVRTLLRDDDPVQAMWLARLAAGLELRWAERATTEVLRHPAVARALRTIRRRPWERHAFFAPPELPWWPQTGRGWRAEHGGGDDGGAEVTYVSGPRPGA